MVEIVTVDVAELGRVIAVHNVVRPDDPTTVEELVDWRRQTEDTIWLVAAENGADAGAAVGLVGWHSEPGTAFAEFWTLPQARGHGAGTALLDELGRWSAERGSVALDTVVAEDDEPSLAWATRRGLTEVGRESRLVLELDEIEAPEVEPPAGIEIVPWSERPDVERGLYEVYLEAEPDIPGEEDNEVPPFETWLANDMQGVSDRPEAVFVALAGDEVVGYAKLAFPQASSRVFHDLTGVKRSWRRHGIAASLKRTQIRWAKEQGYAQLVTGNEARNEPIRRLNERHGYRVEPGRIVLRKDLSGGA